MPEEETTPRCLPRRARVEHALGADDQLPIDPDLEPNDPGEPSAAHWAGGRPGMHRAHPRVLAAIFVGGFLGTWGRYAVEDAWPTPTGHFPTATFVINTGGAFLLGLVLTVLLERLPRRGRSLRLFLATGVIGGWTTYSTLVVEGVTLVKDGRAALGAGYAALTVVCGVTAVALGIGIGRSRALAPGNGQSAEQSPSPLPTTPPPTSALPTPLPATGAPSAGRDGGR